MDSAIPTCKCGLDSVLHECRNGKPENIGKKFWSCATKKTDGGCDFFKWASSAGGQYKAPTLAPTKAPQKRQRDEETETDEVPLPPLPPRKGLAGESQLFNESAHHLVDVLSSAASITSTTADKMVSGVSKLEKLVSVLNCLLSTQCGQDPEDETLPVPLKRRKVEEDTSPVKI